MDIIAQFGMKQDQNNLQKLNEMNGTLELALTGNSQSNGGYQRDEFSSGMGATNRNNSSWDYRDNDNDGVTNRYDRSPEPKSNCYGYYCD